MQAANRREKWPVKAEHATVRADEFELLAFAWVVDAYALINSAKRSPGPGCQGCRGIIRAREEGGHNSRACLAAGRDPVPAVGWAARPTD
jgi:hypothetical protein